MTKQIYAKEYQDYLITGKEESLNSLVSSSIEKDYFLLIRRLLKEDLTKELQKDINDFLQRIDNSQSYRLKALNIFKKLEKSFEKNEIIIEDIKELFSLGNAKTYNKPYKYTLKSEEKKIDDVEESEKYPSSLNLSDYIKTNKFIEDIYTDKIDPNDNEYKNIFKKNKCDLFFDFNKIPIKTLVKILVYNKDYENIAVSVIKSISYSKIDHFKNVFKQVVNEVSKYEKLKQDLTDFIYPYLNIFLNEQIKILLEYKDVFNFDKLILELISREISFDNYEDKKENIQKLKSIQQMLKDYYYDKITNSVLLSLFELNSDLNIYDKDLFIEYIKYPLASRSIYNLSDDIKEKINKNEKEAENFLDYLRTDKYKEENIIRKYLKNFYLR